MVAPALGADYNLRLATRSTTGLGSTVIDNVLGTVGVQPAAVGLRWSEVLNDAGALEFSLPIDHALVTKSNFAVGQREIHLFRNGTLVWGGKLWTADVQGWWVRFVARSWYWDLTRREVRTDYSTTQYANHKRDQFDIVRDLVGGPGLTGGTQAETDGGLGITFWSNAQNSGTERRVVICTEEKRKVSDAIEDLASAKDGLDFAVLPDKTFQLWSPQRGSTPGLTFDGSSGITDFGYQDDASDLNTEVSAVGSKQDCAEPFVQTVHDDAARTIYGLLQDSVDVQHFDDDAHALAVAQEALDESKAPRLQPRFAVPLALAGPTLTAYNIGDTITVTTARGPSDGFGNFSAAFRVLGRDVSVSAPGYEVVVLTVDGQAFGIPAPPPAPPPGPTQQAQPLVQIGRQGGTNR
jgi:hypothetical protein